MKKAEKEVGAPSSGGRGFTYCKEWRDRIPSSGLQKNGPICLEQLIQRKESKSHQSEMKKTCLARLLFFFLVCSSAQYARSGTPAIGLVEPVNLPMGEGPGVALNKAFDTLWGLPVLYRDKENPFIQEAAFIGRYQGQIFSLNSDFGPAGGWQNRRQRFGGMIKFLGNFEAHVEFNLNLNGANTGRFVQDYERFGVKWSPCQVFQLEVGLYKVPITNEWRTSSNTIITIERSDVVNMAVPRHLGGVLASGEVPDGITEEGRILYGAGIYSATRSENWQYPTFDGGSMLYGGIGYRLNKNHEIRSDHGILVGNTDEPTNATKPYTYTTALSYSGKFHNGKFWLQSDVVVAIGEGAQPNLYGFIFLPSYMLTEQIEIVARYQYLVSNEANGVRLQSRYETRAPELPTSLGNNYTAIYGGGELLYLQGPP